MAHSIGLDYTVFDSQQNFSFVSVDPDSQYSVEGQTPLIAAAFAGNSDIIEFLLRNGASIDAKDSAGCTALTRAVCLQHTSAVQKLLIAGADPTIGTTTGANALHFACANGNVPIVEHLLAHIQPESLETSVSGFSPLALCAAAGHIECVKVLCSAITSANIKQVALDIPLKAAAEGSQQHIIETITTYFEPCIGSRTVQPALLSASRSGDVVIVKQLLKFVQGDVHELHGSFNEAAKHGHIIVMDLLWTHYNGRRLAEQYCPPSGWITLVLAAEAGQANTVRFLLDKGFQADVGTADGFTPLMASAKHGHLSIVQDLLAAGASPNSATSAGDSALILATRYGHASIVRELLGSGSDFNAKTVTGDLTALLFASKNGSGALIQLLLGHGAPLETCAANGFTPLLLAVQGGHAEAVRIILDAGANPDKSSESETKDFWRSRDSTRTPLELAVEGAHTEIVDLLLKQGADTETTGSRWETALEIAASSGHKDIVAHLLDAGALRLQEAFNKAYHKNHEDIIGLLTIQGVEFTHPHDAHVYWHGRWPLLPQDTALSTDLDLRVTTTTWTEWPDDFEIAESGNIEDVHQYLDAGGDVDVAHSNGHTALLSAVANDYQDIVALLLANGADCNIEIDGCTALLLAAGNGNHQIVAELITFGADTRFRSCGDRWDAYALAAFHGHVRVLEVLFDAIGETFPEYEDRYRFRDSHCLPKDAIFDAASNGHSDMVKFLLSRGIYDEFAAPTLYSNAALNGHIAVICVLVHAGADYLYAHDEDGPYHGPWSPLVAAASRGHAEIVALLLGLSPSFPDRAKAEAFSGACDNQHIAVLQELLRVGMNLEQFFLGVDPLLISAVKCGDSSVLDVLLEASSGKTTAGLFRSSPVTDAIDSSSTAALHHAAHDGRSDMVAALLNAGASKDLQDGNGWTALMHACHKSHEDVARLLLRQDCRTDCIDSVGRSALSLACTNGLSLVVERLIKAGADISSGVALVQAVRQNRLEVVQILLLAGVNVDIQTEDGWSALPEAARLNSLQMVQLLLAGGADTETAFKSGWTALAFVARDGHHDIVDTLLVAGADPNTTVSNSYTPLSLAARGGHLQTVMSMLTHTRSSMFTTGSTLALEEAARHGYEGICSALLDKFGRCSNARLACATAAKRAEVNNHTKVAETIHQHEDLWRAQSCEGKHEHDICEVSPELALRELQRSIGPTKEDKIDSIQPSIELTHAMAYGSVVSGNPLFLAIETADNAAAMHLLDSGESVATGDCGITALHVACRSGNRQIVEVLVNRGTDVNVQTTTIEPLERLMRETFPEGVPKDLRQPVDVAYLSDAREKCPGMDANLCESCMTLIPSINDFVLEHETPAREEIFTTPQILFSAIKGCPGCAMAFQFIRTLFGRATLTSDPIYRQVELHNTWKVDDLQNILFARSMFSSRHNKNRTFEFDEEGLGIGDIRPREWQNRFNPRKVVDGSLSWDFQTLLIKYSVPKDLPQLCKYIVYADEDNPAAKYTSSRPYNSDLQDDACYATIREWIHECDSSHEACAKLHTSSLPTRVIDVGSLRVSPRLHLTNNEIGSYVALSYCWGRSQTYCATEASLPMLLSEINLERLPQTIKDAIEVTRAIGLQYLWVDSLCILQDSMADKVIELGNMAQVYKAAYLTISAASAASSDQGFLHTNQARRIGETISQEQHTVKFPFRCESGEIGTFALEGPVLDWSFLEHHRDPINKRAWTLQEHWLSPRIIMYSTRGLSWLCHTKRHSYGGPAVNPFSESIPKLPQLWHDKRVEDVESNSKFPKPNEDGYWGYKGTPRELAIASVSKGWTEPREWTERVNLSSFYKLFTTAQDLALERWHLWDSLVVDYTARQLTNGDDKLTAISGLASEFGRISNQQYLAGLWHYCLLDDLMWYTTSPSKSSGTYRAPSWSWAAVDSPVMYLPVRLSFALSTGAIVQACSTILLDEKLPYGQVSGGSVIIDGSIRAVALTQGVRGMTDIDNSWRMLDCFTDEDLAAAWLDTTEFADGIPPHMQLWALGMRWGSGPMPLDGLIVAAVGNDEGQFRRIGAFFIGRIEKYERYKYFWTGTQRSITII